MRMCEIKWYRDEYTEKTADLAKRRDKWNKKKKNERKEKKLNAHSYLYV